jgi:hypothetical protein
MYDSASELQNSVYSLCTMVIHHEIFVKISHDCTLSCYLHDDPQRFVTVADFLCDYYFGHFHYLKQSDTRHTAVMVSCFSEILKN